MTIAQFLPTQSIKDSRDQYGSVVAVSLQDAEMKLDAFIASLGEAVAVAANGRVQNRMQASVLQPALTEFSKAMSSAIESRGHILRTHAAAAKAGRREGIDWTTVMGPTEPTPLDPKATGG